MIKKIISIISVLFICVITFNFFSGSIYAITTEDTKRIVTRRWGGSSSSLSGATGYWGYPTFKLWYDGSIHTEEGSSYYVAKTMTNGSTAAYCLEPGIGINTGIDYKNCNLDSYLNSIDTSGYVNVSRAGIERLLSLVLYYGFQGQLPGSVTTNTTGKSFNDAAYYIATQAAIWEVICDCIHDDGTRVGDEYFSQHPGVTALPLTRVASLPIFSSEIIEAYNYILGSIQRRTVNIPSFTSTNLNNAPTAVLKWDPTSGRYVFPGGLTDDNSILNGFNITRLNSTIDYFPHDNILELSSVEPLNDSVTLQFECINSSINGITSSLVWQSLTDYNAEFDQWQAIIEANGIVTDKVMSYLKVITQPVIPGSVAIYKTGEMFSSTQDDIELGYEVTRPMFSNCGLEGATYEIRAVSDIICPDGTHIPTGTLVGTIITNSEGYGVCNNLYQGSYKITEVSAPTGYELDTEDHYFELQYDFSSSTVSSINIDVTDNRFNTTFNLQKEIEEVNEAFQYGDSDYAEMMRNIVFGLFSAEEISGINGIIIPSDTLIDIATPVIEGYANQGRVQFDLDYPSGQYYVMELETDPHLILDQTRYYIESNPENNFSISINDGESIMNRLGKISGIKTDEVNSNCLSGATIGLFSSPEEENPIIVYETNEDGYFEFCNLPLGSYYLREISAPEGYYISENVIEINLSNDNSIITDIEIINRPFGSIEGQKLDGTTLEGLSGAMIGLFRSNDSLNPIETYITGENGYFEFCNLEWGTYYIKELSAPVNYEMDSDILEIIINEETVNVSGCNLTNSRRLGSIIGQKVDEETNNSLEGARIGLFVDLNNDPIAVSTTDEAGTFNFSNLEWGTYYIKEIEAPLGYLNDSNPIEVIINCNQVVYDEIKITNRQATGKIVGHKTDGDGNPLSGAIMGLFNEDEEDLIVRNAIIVSESNEDGIFEFNELPFGTYKVAEIEAPDGFTLSTNVITVPVYTTEIIEIGFVNDINITRNNPSPSETPTPTPETPQITRTGENDSGMRIVGLSVIGISVISMLCGYAISRMKD